MTEEKIKEEFSKAYTIAVASKAGVNYSLPNYDCGVDGHFRGVGYDPRIGEYDNGITIDYQLKSTINAPIINGELVYDLDVKNYRSLIRVDRMAPIILIVYSMPEQKDEWLNIDGEKTVLKKCAWWCSLRGRDDTDNEYKIRIKIPESQVLTPQTLKELIDRVGEGELI